MRTHTNDFKNNIKNLGRQFNVRVVYGSTTLQNEEINSSTLNYNGDILKSVMKVLKLDSNIDIPLNTQITFEFGILVGNSYEYINYGTFIVNKSEKQENTNSYLLTCYDKMLYSMKPYEDLGITYPITIQNYISALCTKLGLQFQNASDNFVNYNKQIPNELYLDEQGNSLDYNFRDVLDELAQVTASTICINDSGKLEIRYITDTNDTIDEEFLKNVNVNFGEQYGAINTITFSRSADSDSISKSIPENLPDADKIEIKISDNQILNGNNRDEFIDGILNKLYGLSYYINDFSSTGITYYDLCDRYNITVGENTYSCVMLNDEININNGLVENIFTNMPETSKTDYSKVDKTDRKTNQTYLIVDKQQGQINAVVSQVDEIEQELANPTSIKEGEYFDLEDALDEPLIDFSLYGETQQDSTTGKNLFGGFIFTKTNNGITYNYYKDGSISAKGTATSSSTSMVSSEARNNNYLATLGAGTYTLQGGTNQITIEIIKSDGTGITSTNGTKTFTIDSETQVFIRLAIASGTNISNGITIYQMLEKSSSATSYEPYTNGASPNPDYPQEIHNVSGDNTIEICGKNLLRNDLTSQTLNDLVITVNDDKSIKINGTANANTWISINGSFNFKSGKTYVLSGCPQNGSLATYYMYANGQSMQDIGSGVSKTFSEDTTTSILIKISKNAVLNNLVFKPMIEVNNEATEYEPYTGNSQLISLGVENLFDKSNIETGKYYKTSAIDTSSNWAISQVKVQPNTNYYLSGNNYNNNTAKIVLLDSSKNILSSVGGYYNTHLITTSSTTAYIGLSISMYEGVDDLNTIQLEKGSKANSYSEYGKPYIELNKISTYQDYIYKDNDIWYLHKEIGKVVLNGSETWTKNQIDTSGKYYFRYTPSGLGQQTTNGKLLFSNYFTPTNTWKQTIVGMWFDTNLIIKTQGSLDNTESVDDFKTWLSTHNTTIYYVLDTPTDTEITDTTLLGQLNRLMTLPLYKNMTHITLTPNDLQPTMKIEYYRDTSLNNTFVPKTEMSKYYTKTETIAQIQIGNSSIQQNVAEIQTTLDSNGEAINTISNQVQTLQSATSLQISTINSQLENGVEKLTNSLVKIDANGINTSKTGETFNTQITNKSFEVKDSNKELVYLGYDNDLKKTVARMDWLESEHATIGTHRVETITKNGKKRTAWFYVGGGN